MVSKDFAAIYQLYFAPVYRYVLGLCSSPDLADEITAQTFLKSLERLDSFQAQGSLEGWLKTIARNTYFDYLKQQKRYDLMETLEAESSHPLPEEIVEASESVSTIRQILSQIDSPYREVFELRVIQELSFKEIARLYHKSDNWACVTYHRAKNQIQQQMKEKS